MKFTTKLFLGFFSFVFSGIIILSTMVMLGIILPYTSWEWDIDFLLTKQYIIHLDHYRIAFYTHIFSSLIVLVSGAFLFSPFVLRKYSSVHKIFGKLYVGLILLQSAPSGLIMALYANGGALTKLSCLLLTPLWWFFTLKGYLSIRNGNLPDHKKWMIRSYALTLSAISLRVYQFAFGYFNVIDPDFQYLFVSWVSWVGNLLVAEVIIRYKELYYPLRYSKSKGIYIE